jgi:hypothetical protein
MIFKNNDTRVEKPYDTRICRNMIITWATLSEILGGVNVKISELNKDSILRKYIFLTIDGTTITSNGEEAENFQVLGFAYGEDLDSATSAFFEEYDWVLNRGFSKREIQTLEIAGHSRMVFLSDETEE